MGFSLRSGLLAQHKMAHEVWLWFLAALLLFALFVNHRVIGTISYSSTDLFNIRNQLLQQDNTQISDNQYKKLVKDTNPKILKSKKRGKRGDVKTKLFSKHNRGGLPGILQPMLSQYTRN